MILSYTEAAALMTPAADPNDPKFQLDVAAVNETIVNYCDRNFDRATYTEVLSGFGSNRLRVSHYPLASITSLWIDPYGEFAAGSLVSDLTRYVVGGDNESNVIISLDSWFWRGSRTAKVTYVAGYWPADDPDPLHVPKMPSDLRRAAAKMIAFMQSEGFKKNVASMSLGAYSVAYQTQSLVPENWTDIDPSIVPTLDRYKRYYL